MNNSPDIWFFTLSIFGLLYCFCDFMLSLKKTFLKVNTQKPFKIIIDFHGSSIEIKCDNPENEEAFFAFLEKINYFFTTKSKILGI
jgi:hypothetical protein